MEIVSTSTLEKLVAIFIASGFGILASRIAWKKGYYILPTDVDVKKRVSGLYVFAAFVIFFICEILLNSIFSSIWIYWYHGEFLDPSTYPFSSEFKGWMNLLVFTFTFIAMLSYFCSLDKPHREMIWGSPSEIRSFRQNIKDFFVGSVSWILAYPWVIVIGQILAIVFSFFYTGPLQEQVVVQHLRDILEHPGLFGATIVMIVTVIPFIEELLFRGFLQSWLKSVIGRNKAIIITALIFAFFHFSISQGIENIEFIASLFLFSCYLGFVKERQQSLWASIGLHATFNFISVLMLLFMEK